MNRRRWLAAAAAVTVVGVAAVIAAGGDEPGRAAEPAPERATALVERRDLVDREQIAGTLGYADPGTLAAGAAGTLTGLRDPGSVVTRGHSLYALDGRPAAFLLYGELPSWRDYAPGMTDGEDVRALERNLRALGHAPGAVDGDWDADTTAAVQRFQRARALDDDGTLARGEVVFRPGPTRIGAARASVGDTIAPGKPLADVSATARRVTVALDARRQRVAREGDRVTVELPSGRTARGRIEDVGKVASKAGEDADPTIDVTIALAGAGGGLDQAPVDVGFAVERRRDVLAVPIKALLARQGGGYALELPGGRLIDVTLGMYADDMVEVEGTGLREGLRVVTAQ